MVKASEYHNQGYTCGEAMIKAFNEEHKTDILVALGSGMGAGLTVGSVCGAVVAANVIIGYLKGRESNEEKNEARKHAKELISNVKEKYGTELCRELKKNKVACSEIIEHTYEDLNKIIK